MPLKITTAADPIKVETVCITIYAQPGLGKTSLAFTAPNPLMLDFDKGSYRAVDRKDVVQVSEWSDVAGISKDDLAAYDTIIIDTVGKALDALASDIIAKNPRHAYGGALNQQGWGQLGVRFGAFLKLLRGFGKDIVLVSHMDEKPEGDIIKERLKIQGGSKDLVSTDSDAMARISLVNKERHLIFSPTEASFGKDPAGLGFVVIPDASKPEYKTFLGDTLAGIKGKLNELSEAQIERRSEVEWFEQTLPNIMQAEDLNELLGRAKRAGGDVARMVVRRANELGLEFDPETRKYHYLEDLDPSTVGDDREQSDAD